MALSSLLGLVGSAASDAKKSADKVLNQSIDIATGDIDTKQIIKSAIMLLILFGFFILLINIVRGVLIGVEQIGCGITHIFGESQVCDPFNENTIILNTFWMWPVEWILLCLFYICFAVIFGLLLYRYCLWLYDKLLKIDRDIKKIENWIFGSTWEGEVENQMQTKF